MYPIEKSHQCIPYQRSIYPNLEDFALHEEKEKEEEEGEERRKKRSQFESP